VQNFQQTFRGRADHLAQDDVLYPTDRARLVSGIEKFDAGTFFINLSLWLAGFMVGT
jgi:hypothetical protein